MTIVFSYFIAMLAGLSAFFFALSLLPSKSLLSEQLEELKARDPFKREETRFPLLERMFDKDRRIALAYRLSKPAGTRRLRRSSCCASWPAP